MGNVLHLSKHLQDVVYHTRNVPVYKGYGVNKRPDIRYFEGAFLTIVEVDEHG